MPTGYTADIANGISFEKFVWTCARAFGALVTMRDDPSDAQIPQQLEPSGFYAKQLAESKAELASLLAMSPTEVKAQEVERRTQELARRAQYKAEKAQQRMLYEDMLARVTAWTPPTNDHVELRKFMIDQITESIRFDCDTSYEDTPIQELSAADWFAQKKESLERRVIRDEKSLAQELDRTARRNGWIAALRSSVPQPAV